MGELSSLLGMKDRRREDSVFSCSLYVMRRRLLGPWSELVAIAVSKLDIASLY